MRARTTLSINLLGRLDVRVGDVAIRIGGRHAQALLGLLALRPRARLRDALAAELWPDAGSPSAASLRQALWAIRSGLIASGFDAERWLDVDQDTLGLRRDLTIDLDVDRFERLAASPHPDERERAIRLYAGELLEGLAHECFAADRERLADLHEDLLATVARERLDRGDELGARSAALNLLARDPLREEAHSVLIAVYGRTGSRSQVIRQYRRVCAILDAELAVPPLPETEATFRIALAASATRSRARAAEMTYEAGPFTPLLVTTA